MAILNYHFVWRTKNQEPILVGDVKKRVRELLRTECEAQRIEPLDGGIIGTNYIHLILSCDTGHSPKTVAQALKGKSSRFLSLEFPRQIKPNLWEEGYLCLTFNVIDNEETNKRIADYIEFGFSRKL